MHLCYRTAPGKTSSIEAMVVKEVLFPRVGGGTGSVPVGIWAVWASPAPVAAASITARVRLRVSFLIGYSFTALVALRGD
jgi:hypothetical protein